MNNNKVKPWLFRKNSQIYITVKDDIMRNTTFTRRYFSLFTWLSGLITFLFVSQVQAKAQSQKLALQLASTYHKNIDVTEYWVSEKLDGVRGYWDGKQLFTRRGNKISPPKFFTKNWPETALEGELWIGRNHFDKVSSIVRKHHSTEQEWWLVRFMLFDAPEIPGSFSQRLGKMKQLVLKANNSFIEVIPQFRVANITELNARLIETVKAQGEGLMLHHQNALYSIGRSEQVLKLKTFTDAEARVIGYIGGKGKYRGMLGALQVKTPDGIEFKIGTGFSDDERKTPPPIGSLITYKYSGKTSRGVPRFASFLRIRYLPGDDLAPIH